MAAGFFKGPTGCLQAGQAEIPLYETKEQSAESTVQAVVLSASTLSVCRGRPVCRHWRCLQTIMIYSDALTYNRHANGVSLYIVFSLWPIHTDDITMSQALV